MIQRKVIFSKDIASLMIDGLPSDTLIVVHEMYDKPNIDVRMVDWQRFKETYTEYETSQYVLIGANRMITPSNRCNMVNDFLQILTRNIPKISIDTSPFIGEPWRLWFHYSLAFGEWLGLNYSYPVEGEWLRWFYYDENSCRISGDNLSLFVKDTQTDLARLTTNFELYDPQAIEQSFYEEARQISFDNFTSTKLLINNLLRRCNDHFGVVARFDSYLGGGTVRLPDLPIYRYVVEENRRRMDIYNYFTI